MHKNIQSYVDNMNYESPWNKLEIEYDFKNLYYVLNSWTIIDQIINIIESKYL